MSREFNNFWNTGRKVNSEEQQALRKIKIEEEEASNNLRFIEKRFKKADKVRIMLSQALTECGDGKELEEVRAAIGAAISKINQSLNKNVRKFKTNKEMVELAQKKQNRWWSSIESGLGIKPSLETPNITKEIKDESE